MKFDISIALAFCMGVMGVAAAAAPPADDAVAAAVKAFTEATASPNRNDPEGSARLQKEAAVAAMRGIELLEASALQITELKAVIAAAGLQAQAVARLDQLAQKKDKEGATAMIARLAYLPSTSAGRRGATDAEREKAALSKPVHAAALQQIADHPALTEALADSNELLTAVGRIDREVMRTAGPQMKKIGMSLSTKVQPIGASFMKDFFDTLMTVDNLAPADRERIRLRMVDALRGVQGKADPQRNVFINNSLEYISGPWARGELVGHVAPPLDVSWSTFPTPIASVADLKGKVVVLDWFATWCGPCIGSFPRVSALQAHYKDSPVVILGVTSLQGYHMDRPQGRSGTARRIETKDDPAKEYELMKTFIQQLDMTWPVVFTRQPTPNREWGFTGIPHVAIVDSRGVVRHRGLHAGPDLMDLVDNLLREAKLPVPARPAATAASTSTSN